MTRVGQRLDASASIGSIVSSVSSSAEGPI
jgi:hypothetical protein